MPAITPCPMPKQSVLFDQSMDPAHYADCYRIDVPFEVDLPRYIAAFFQSPFLRLERALLTLMGQGSRAKDVVDFAQGQSEDLALWGCETRQPDQIVMLVAKGRIRSWLSVAPEQNGTRLYFGSTVSPLQQTDGSQILGRSITALGGFHRLYSRIILATVARRLARFKS